MKETIMQQPLAQNRPAEDIVDLSSLLRIFWAGKMQILFFMGFFAILGLVYALGVAKPIYRATSVVVLESREASVAGLDSVLGELSTGTTSVVRTEIEVLRGRTLIGRVVDELNLTEDPDFNPALRSPGVLGRLIAMISSPAEDGRSPEERLAETRSNTVTALIAALKIQNISGSLVFQIEASSSSPVKSAKIADSLARLYIDDQRRVRFEATEQATTWLTDQLAQLRVDLERAETEVRRFQSTTNLIDAGSLAAMERQLKETRSRRDQGQLQSRIAREKIAAISAVTDPREQARLSRDERLIMLAHSIDSAGARTEFEAQLNRFLMRLNQDVARLESQTDSLGAAADTMAADIERQSQDLIRLEQLSREAQSNSLLYEHFQTRLKETAAQLGLEQADSRILSDAVIPSAPAEPRKKLVLAAAVMLGLVLGIFFVILREMQSKSLRSSRDLEALTGRTVLAQIPVIPVRTSAGSVAWLGSNPTSAPAEAVRNLRTSLLLSSLDKAPQIVVMTSSLPGEGKTTLTAALAQNLHAMGQKVLVIEGDIRKQTITRSLAGKVSTESGLISVLRGEKKLSEATRRTEAQGDILPCENAPVSAIDLFASEAFTRLIAEARKDYDIVLIDTPPVLAVPDVRLIAQHADATLFVVRWDHTTSEQVTESLHQLDTVNVRVTGLVLSQVDPAGMRRYGYTSSGYDYGTSYGNLADG